MTESIPKVNFYQITEPQKFELRNKCYNFCTNIMLNGNKEKAFYESDICDVLNSQNKRLMKLEKQIEELNNAIASLQAELFQMAMVKDLDMRLGRDG